jgi:hypothetical protein
VFVPKEDAMRDAAAVTGQVMTARVMKAMDEVEAKRRNALSATKPGIHLQVGDMVTVVDTLDAGHSFLVEFTKSGKAKKDSCDWMGVLTLNEIEVVDVHAKK